MVYIVCYVINESTFSFEAWNTCFYNMLVKIAFTAYHYYMIIFIQINYFNV